jgi:hypothetical protein
VVDLNQTRRNGAIRSNGMNTAKLKSYDKGYAQIYLCLQQVPGDGNENKYTYITTSSNLIKTGAAAEHRLYGRWLKCIYGFTDTEG